MRTRSEHPYRIVGAGRIGGNAASLFANARHEVKLAFARDAAKLDALARGIGARTSTGMPAEAATFSQVMLLAVPWGAIEEGLLRAGSLEGRIIVDTTNQFGLNGCDEVRVSGPHCHPAGADQQRSDAEAVALGCRVGPSPCFAERVPAFAQA